MSYIEHGPRIFCTRRSGNTLSLNYGDYVFLPRKRSEGRLKMFDSCSDIRAWSPNPVENSRYFRELAENAPRQFLTRYFNNCRNATAGKHAGKPGKVPFNVLIEDLIKMGSQTQEELVLVKKELKKYRSLKLTPEQKEELKRIAKSFDEERQSKETDLKGRSLSKIILDTFLSGSNENQREEGRVRRWGNISVIENKDVSIQVQPTVSELAVQYDSSLNIENASKISTDSSSTSNSTLRDENSFCSVSSGLENTELSESESEISRLAFDSEINKSIIIEKESKIIALENEVQVKNAELEEREEKIRGMRKSVRSMKDMLDHKCQEMEDLTTKLHVFKFEKRKLQESLDNQSRVSEVQLDEINSLRFIIDQAADIKNNLSKQLEQMRRERDAFRRKMEMLQQEVKEKTEILAANEKELGGLFLSWKQTTEDHEKSKTKTMEVLRVLETEIEEKNSRICEYETQILNVEQEVGDMFIMLKTSLSEIEFIDKYDCECNNNPNENQNIVSQTKATISNLSLCVKQIETERKSLLKQLDDLRNEKKCIQHDCGVADVETYVNYESSTDYEETPKNSEVEIENFHFDENESKDRPLFKEMSSNCTNSQDCLELQVTDQESTIEMWNCSFDRKIDSAFESHVTTSILKIVKLTEGLKDVETGKMKEIEELKSEIKKRDLEITKLRSQMLEQNSRWKGEGDCYEREQADRNKRELELEEELQTYQHKLLGANEDNFTLNIKLHHLQDEKKLLIEKYEKVHQELQLRNRDWAMNEKYKKKVEEMQSRLRALQLENENLMQELLKANKEIEMQREKIQDLFDRKEKVEKFLYKSREEIQSKNSEIEYLKEENKNLDEKLQKTLKNNAKLEEFKSRNNRNISELLQFQKEVKKLNEEKCRLEEKHFDLQSSFMEYQKENVELESELEEITIENEKLRSCIKTMENQIKVIVDNEIELKKTDYSNILLDKIAFLKEKLENSKLEQEEKGEKIILVTRSTSMDAEFELDFLKDLSKEKEKIHLENESRQKEDEIERLKLELDKKNLEINNMEEKHKQSLIMVTKKKDEEFKKLRSLHDQNVQNLKTSFNSFNSEGFSFGTEDWLKSLSTEEMLDLCERISIMIPSKEFSKTMNSKQKRVTELEYKIAEVTQNTTFKVEELESKIQEEKNKSAKLQERLSNLSQNQDLFQLYPKKNRNKSFKSINFYDDNGPNFPYYIANQESVKSARFLYNRQAGKRRFNSERKSFSGDESSDSKRRDFIHECSTSMRNKYYPSC